MSDERYAVSTSDDSNDTYLSILNIKEVKGQDYGDYYCKVTNSLGTIQPKIRLQPKSAPDTPHHLRSPNAGSKYVTLEWEAGFNGGLSTTKYFVRYRRVLLEPSSTMGDQCVTEHTSYEWMEYDCRRMNPCNVTLLDQNNSYSFKVTFYF